MIQLRSTDDGNFEVCVEEDGFRECGIIQNMDDLAMKQKALQNRLRRRGYESYIEAQAAAVCDI